MADKGNKSDVGRALTACALAWLVPGGGHLFLRKWWHAAVFFVCVTGLALGGWLLNGELHSPLRANAGEGFLQMAAAAGNFALGGLHALFVALGMADGGVEAYALRSYEYGTTFIIVAALINVLVILDALDHARGVKG